MIYGRHDLGNLKLRAPMNHDFADGGAPLMVAFMLATDEDGDKYEITQRLTRSGVERLRELCDEALS